MSETPNPSQESETPPPTGDGAPDAEASKTNLYKPGKAKFGISYHGKHLDAPKRRPFRDHANIFIGLTMLFLLFCIAFFMWNYYETSRPRITIYTEPPKELYPIPTLVRANETKQIDGDVYELTYDFDAVAKDTKARNLMLKDWKGGRNAREDIREKGTHRPIQVDRTFGVPMAPLLSEVSFEHDFVMEVTLQPRQPVLLYLLFYYFYSDEATGTALVISPEGQARFIRYRADLRYDEPRGDPGLLELPLREKTVVRIEVKEFEHGAGYRAKAFVGEKLITQGDFIPEWPQDRRYLRPERDKFLVADNPIPPQSGFVAVAASQDRSVLIHRITVRGTVAEMWREQRTDFMKALGLPPKPQNPQKTKMKEGAKGQPAENTPAPTPPIDLAPAE